MSPKILKRLSRCTSGARRAWIALPAVALLLSGCDNDVADDDASNTYVFVVDLSTEDSDFVLSDVCLSDPNNPAVCSVVNDNAIVTMRAAAKDQTKPVGELVNDIFFNRYRVTYVRSDGRNVPGVDVPFSFDGGTTFRVPVGGQADQAFIVVRHQAKVEDPLSALADGGGAFVLSTIAQVDFFGTDGAGRQVKATGFITISFADFPDDP